MQFKKILFFAVAAVVMIGLLLPLTASAAGWSAPFALGSGNIKPSVAIGSDGSVHYLWFNGSTIQYVKCNGLAKSSCGSVENLPNKGPSYYPSLALDADNRANAVWEAKDGSASVYSIYYSRRSGSKWSTPKRLSTETYSELPDIAIGGNGTIHVVYQNKSGQEGFVNYTTANSNMDFSAPIVLEQMTSDNTLPVVAEVGLMTPEGNLASGFYPRVAADGEGKAYAVWQMPGYGIGFRYQTNGSDWSATKKIGGSHKDQTPDVTVNKDNRVGVVWTMYDSGDISFAEFNSGSVDYQENDVDSGLTDSFWPKIASDCTGAFHFAYQGRTSASGSWDIYHATYNPDTNTFGSRTTIASISAVEQTPAIDATNVAAIVYTNSTNGIIDASTNNLNLNCSNATATPTFTPSPTNTPDPNITPTDTPTPASELWIPNTSSDIAYKKSWKTKNAKKATDKNYQRCDADGVCKLGSGAKIIVPDGYTRVEWYTAKSNIYGIANVWINDGVNSNNKPSDSVDLCKGATKTKPKFIKFTYTVPARSDGQPRTFEIGGTGKHSSCTASPSNFVVVDGFKLLP